MKRAKFHHSIIFGDGTLVNGQFTGLDTYEDFHLIPSSRPTIAAPGVETKFVTVPGRDGSYDMSEYLRSGRPAYGDRTGSFEFTVENDYDLDPKAEEFWMTIYPRLFNALHGRKFKMVLKEDDPDYYWEGRFTVDKYEPDDGSHSKVTISYAVSPFKRKIRKNSEKMVWDNFNFEKDYDHDPIGYTSLSISNPWSGKIFGDGYYFPIEVTALSGSGSVTFGGETVSVSEGQTRTIGHAAYGLNDILIVPSQAPSTFKIDWRGGSL